MKWEATRRIREEGQSPGDVAAELGAHECLVRKWSVADRRRRGEKINVVGPAFAALEIQNESPRIEEATYVSRQPEFGRILCGHRVSFGYCRMRSVEACACRGAVAMIAPSNTYKIYLAISPVDFRKGMDGLANYVLSNIKLDPMSGAVFVFRSKGRDKIKILMWDGTGPVLIYKRIESAGFVWPKLQDGTISLTKAQFEALFEGLDWRRVASAKYYRPNVA